MNLRTVNSHTFARETVERRLPPTDTQLKILYYMKLTRELEYRIERKLYRQGKIVGGVYVGRGQEAIAVSPQRYLPLSAGEAAAQRSKLE